MKKSVIIVIAVVYIAAIALVSFFGLQFKVFNEIIPVEGIEILNEGLKENELWGKYTVISLDENGTGKFLINYRVFPDNATNATVEFSYDTQNTVATVDSNGLVTFTGAGMIKIQLIAADGSDASATLTVIAK